MPSLLRFFNHERVVVRGNGEVHVQGRVNVIFPVNDLVVEVRAGNHSAPAGEAYAVSPFHLLPFRHVQARHVCISCPVAESMVYFHVLSITAKVAVGLNHDAVAGGIDGVSRVAGEVHAGVQLKESKDGMAAVAEGAREPVGVYVCAYGRNCRDVRCQVTCRLLQGRYLVKGSRLHEGALFKDIQPADDAAQRRTFQGRIGRIGHGRPPHFLRNAVEAIYAAVNALVPFLDHGQDFVVLVQLAGHLVKARAPFGIAMPQEGGFWKILVED